MVGDIGTAWVSNYMIDMEFLAEECPALFKSGKLIVCHGMADRGVKTAMLEIAQAEGRGKQSFVWGAELSCISGSQHYRTAVYYSAHHHSAELK